MQAVRPSLPAPPRAVSRRLRCLELFWGSRGLRPRQAGLQPFPILSLLTSALPSRCTCQPPWALGVTFDLGLTLPLGVGAVGPEAGGFVRKEQFNGLFTMPVLNLKSPGHLILPFLLFFLP